MQEPIPSTFNDKYWQSIKTLNQYADIFSEYTSGSVELSCVKHDIHLIGTRIIEQGGVSDLDSVYLLVDDKTKDIHRIFATLK